MPQELDRIGKNVLEAKELYLSGFPVADIAKRLGVHPLAVSSWAKKGQWESERNTLDTELISSLKLQRTKMIPKAIDLGINLIYNAFKLRMSSGDPLSIGEAKIVSSVIGDIDKLVRLDAGDPTDIQGAATTIPITLEELRKVVARDPFISTIELKEGIDYGSDTGTTETKRDIDETRNDSTSTE